MTTSSMIIKSFNTIKEMIFDRMDSDDANNKTNYNQSLQYLLDHLNGVGEIELKALATMKSAFCIHVDNKLMICYILTRFSTQSLKDCLKDVRKDSNIDHCIVILKDKGTNSNLKILYEHLEAFSLSKSSVEVFELKELVFNISHHTYVPKHILIPSEKKQEIESIMNSLNVKNKSQLPVILKTDPMARYLNAKTGDLIKIIHYPITSGEHYFYRICV
jgi:DNA-directed RNA polymerase I, II, and III subunit RPABC1